MELQHDELLRAYRRMRMIRLFEEKLSELVQAGKMGGFLHLYAGEEAVAVGVCSQLGDDDIVTSTHRGHGHCIAKGVDVKGMMAELFGRATGTCKGKGGSMHIADMDKGMLGANGIVGAGIPLATGAGLTAKIRKTDHVAVAFFGDGATNQGQFHESLNMASNWKLPVVYVVENNGFGEFTPTEFVVPVKDIAERAHSYAMESEIADGMDFFDVAEKTARALERARAGEGPTLLECKTYRFLGHFAGDPLVYRSKEQAEDWIQNRDPLDRFETHATEAGLVTADELREVDGEVERELQRAVDEAQQAPFPDVSEVLTDVYVETP
ncbi:MAG: pyruvate dehydrogenase (acetyl-transferring) E1 component subunit alpha [Deltaproteobacteria bacterium]|jgi:pyruvate dehydrogenase E1 component alpha subunit|nr:pyruvate dehydrogenase (acetyl-transferring) E1 component subunit alpha [Deltaproteobacteria bacterium]